MYEFVSKNEIRDVSKAVRTIINNVQKSSLREYFTFDFFLIGSGAKNLVTRNGDEGAFDLDYNFVIQKDKQGLINNPKKIKELFINAFNDSNPGLGFNPANNSTSVITSRLVYGNRLHFSFDVAILCEGNNGNYLKIVQNKTNGQYYWNEIKSSREYKSKMDVIKEAGLWNELRENYLNRKNLYLTRNEEKASFSVLLEVLNELYSQIK